MGPDNRRPPVLPPPLGVELSCPGFPARGVVPPIMATADWKMGDRVIHAGRPEWGIGEVRSAEVVHQDGQRAQRLTIRFDRAGVKVISTAFAELRADTARGRTRPGRGARAPPGRA